MRLKRLIFTPRKITKGIEHARNMKSIEEIGTQFENRGPPSPFWKLYDAGEYK